MLGEMADLVKKNGLFTYYTMYNTVFDWLEQKHSITSWTSRPSRGPAWNAGDKEQSEGPCLQIGELARKKRRDRIPGKRRKKTATRLGVAVGMRPMSLMGPMGRMGYYSTFLPVAV